MEGLRLFDEMGDGTQVAKSRISLTYRHTGINLNITSNRTKNIKHSLIRSLTDIPKICHTMTKRLILMLFNGTFS
jgi:tRNA A-37 threonylcarbamoyl transferase component Bud32